MGIGDDFKKLKDEYNKLKLETKTTKISGYKNLFNFEGDDFEVYESELYGSTYFKVSIEGYMGFENFESFIGLYEKFKIKLEKYLIDNHEKTYRDIGECVYKTRAIDVSYESNCYWIFLDTFKTTQIWDIYYYMEDVIEQLKEVKDKI